MTKQKDDLADLIGGGQGDEPQVPAAAAQTDDTPAADPGAVDLDKAEADRVAAEIAANKEKISEEAPPVLTSVNAADATVLDAHLRRQANWEKESAEYFPGKALADQRREKLLEDISKIEAENNKEKAKLARQAARDAAKARVTELKAANEQLYVQIEANDEEIKQQTALANAPEPDDKPSKKKG